MSNHTNNSKEDGLRDFLRIMLARLAEQHGITRDDIAYHADKYAQAIDFDGDLEPIIAEMEASFTITMDEGVSLIDSNVSHNEKWYKGDSIEWEYWKDYKLLLRKHWPPNVVPTFDQVTNNILGLLADPRELSGWDRRGLVIGHVQSGKTANYLGLLTKAADAGYKFIIVIAGIHNNLRKQAQQRINEGFIGRDIYTAGKSSKVGVGETHPDRRFPVSLTNVNEDFTKNTANAVAASLQGFSRPVVVVIKKNVNTLKHLYQWLQTCNLGNSLGKIDDIPMLMIDDEADLASINTNKNKDDIDPTKTNKMIRKILALFKNKCYVGYTATPFANIFINPDSNKDMLDLDLFPKDFIYCLDAPANYYGPDKIFLDEDKDEEEGNSRYVNIIDDAEEEIPLSHKKNYEVKRLPHSMKQAINMFVIARAIRILRQEGAQHSTMMIHASRLIDVQRQIQGHICDYIDTMSDDVQYHRLDQDVLQNEHLLNLKKTYDNEFKDHVKEDWADIQIIIDKSLASIKDNILLINEDSDDKLDYGEPLTAIVVGGLSLSRGLTLENLIISYIYRNTRMYDTLMQMGRWFGYRDNIKDLYRIWLSAESRGWYAHIAEATEELRRQIKQMRQNDRTPKDFALYVRKHPDALAITAPNKMANAEERIFDVSYSGRLRESYIVSSDSDVTNNNRDLVKKLFNALRQQYGIQGKAENKGYCWKDVPLEKIEDFLCKFAFHPKLKSEKDAIIDYIHEVLEKYPNADIAFIYVKKLKDSLTFKLADGYELVCQKRSVGKWGDKVKEPLDGESGYYIGNKQRVASRGAESIGLSGEQIERAKKAASDSEHISDSPYREERGKPLLMIHMLTLMHNKEAISEQVPAVSISFPGGDYDKSGRYAVNRGVVEQGTLDGFGEDGDLDG